MKKCRICETDHACLGDLIHHLHEKHRMGYDKYWAQYISEDRVKKFTEAEDFEYRTIDDLLNTIRQFEPGEYDLSGVQAVLTTSMKKANLDEVQGFITKYRKVCFIRLEGYAPGAKDLILLSDEPKTVRTVRSSKAEGAVIYKDRLFAYNLE